MCIEISNQDTSIAMFNVYMPCDCRENLDEYLHLLSQLSSAAAGLDTSYFAMFGDFNANLQPGVVSLFGKELQCFCQEENLCISDILLCDPKSFTFYSEAHKTV